MNSENLSSTVLFDGYDENCLTMSHPVRLCCAYIKRKLPKAHPLRSVVLCAISCHIEARYIESIILYTELFRALCFIQRDGDWMMVYDCESICHNMKL